MGKRANGSGTLYRRNGWYYAKLAVGDGVMRSSLNTRNRAEAVERLNKLAAGYDLSDEERVAALAVRLKPKTGRRTFEEAWEAYTGAPETAAQSDAARREDRAVFEAFVEWIGVNHRGVECMDDVSDEIAAERFASLRASRAAQTVNKHRRILARVWAINRLESNPWERIGKLPVRCVQREAISKEDLELIIERAEGELRTLFTVGAYTGARLMDCARARWEMVVGDYFTIRTSKTGRLAAIPIHRLLAEEFDRIGRKKTGPIMPDLAGREKWDVSERVQRHFAACGFVETLKRDGYKKAVPAIGFHSLRSTFITRLAEAGVPLAVVREMVGHVSEDMSQRYFRVSRDMAAKAIAAL